MSALVTRGRPESQLVLDFRDAQSVAASVSQAWTEWLRAHADRFARVVAFSPSPLFPLVLTVAKYKSGMERVVRVHRAVEPFRDELIVVT